MASIQKRKSKNGAETYRVRVRMRGFPCQTATFARITDARKWASKIETEIREGKYFNIAESRKHTLGELIDRYLDIELPKKPRSEKLQRTQLNYWKNALGCYLLVDITPALIVQERERLHQQPTPKGPSRSPATVNRYLAALSHALSVAVMEWGWLNESPMKKVKRLQEPRGRDRFLSKTEIDRLLEVAKKGTSPHLYLIVVLAVATGMRQGEILNLKWKDVDLGYQRITLGHTKNGEKRVVPLCDFVSEKFKEFKLDVPRRIDTNYVFPHSKKDRPVNFRKAWEKALIEAGIDNFRFHDLRHTAASHLAMDGATTQVIADILGHKTLNMVKRYAHFTDQHKADAVGRMNNKIFGAG